MTSTLGSGSRRWSLTTEALRIAVQLPHEHQDDGETTEPLFDVPEPESKEPSRATLTVVRFDASNVVVTTQLTRTGYGRPIRLTSFAHPTVEVVDVREPHDRSRGAAVSMRSGADRASTEVQEAIEAARARLVGSRRTRWQAFLDGLGRVFGLQPPRRPVPTVEEALLEAMVQLHEASSMVPAEERPDSQLPR